MTITPLAPVVSYIRIKPRSELMMADIVALLVKNYLHYCLFTCCSLSVLFC